MEEVFNWGFKPEKRFNFKCDNPKIYSVQSKVEKDPLN